MKQKIHKTLQGEGVYGVWFSWILLCLIFLSIMTLMLWSLPNLQSAYERSFLIVEIMIGFLFMVEYILRIWSAQKPWRYVFSFWGIIDLLACLPVLLLASPESIALRGLRVFRLLQVFKYMALFGAYERLSYAFHQVRKEIFVFLALAMMVMLFGAIGIYYFERDAQPQDFGSIPASLWWSVATLTTVGYGDVYPITLGGKLFTGFLLLVGLGIVAVPTALFSTSLLHAKRIPKE